MQRRYATGLTASENDKGVLDLDVVKGCEEGMKAFPDGGCYGACYAAKIARFRGLDFTRSVSRYPRSTAEVRAMVRFVARSPLPFVRIGVMGDPSHDWPGTLRVARYIVPVKPVVIITKHWRTMGDEEVAALASASRFTVNTSVSALDYGGHLAHRFRQHERLKAAGVRSFLRVISCDFVEEHEEGARLAEVQRELLAMDEGRVIRCDALRCPASHPLVKAGVIRVGKYRDLNSEVSMSLYDEGIYRGRCDECPDLCGRDW